MLNKFSTAMVVVIYSLGVFGQTRIVPHLTAPGGGFETKVIIENRSVDTQTYTFTPFDSTGAELAQVTGNLAGQATTIVAAAELLDATASHFTIDAPDIVVTVAYEAAGGVGSPAHVRETSDHATSYRLYGGNWQNVFDGFAVVNTGSVPTDVWVAQRDLEDNIIQSAKALESLAPMGKGLYLIGFPGSETFEQNANTYFEVYGEQNLAITALRGNIPGSTLLWANDAEPRNGASTKRDAQGVWFIEDGSLYDVMETMGYQVAVDRMWQLDTFRWTATGRNAEFMGEEFINVDFFFHIVGYSDQELSDGFRNLDLDSKTVVKAYADGINRRIAELAADPSSMPYEYSVLGVTEIDAWTVNDVMATSFAIMRNIDPSKYGTGISINDGLLVSCSNRFPESALDMFDDIRWLNDADAPTMIREGQAGKQAASVPRHALDLERGQRFAEVSRAYLRRYQNVQEKLKEVGFNIKLGSLAWVVAGHKTASGNPILFSGPQLGYGAPAMTMEGSIRGGGLNVSGMAIPGVPGILVGRTPHHTWSLQTGHGHTSDLYFWDMDAAVLTGGPHRRVNLKVAGSRERVLDIFRTEQGPAVVDLDQTLAWRYTHWGYEFEAFSAMLGIARAQTIDQFGEAVAKIPLSLHVTYADAEGNIAYWMSGRDPVRPDGDFRVTQGLFAPQNTYDLDVIKPMPHERNPQRGYYGGWNNKTTADYNNPPFGWDHQYGPFNRARLMEDYLTNNDNITMEDLQGLSLELQVTDSFGLGGNPWHWARNGFMAAVAANPTEPRNEAVAILESWDGHEVEGGRENWVHGPDKPDGWMLMDAWMRRVIEMTFEDELIEIVEDVEYANLFDVLLHSFDEYSGVDNKFDWFVNRVNGFAPGTRDEIIVSALDQVLAELGSRPWGIDARGVLHFVHDFLVVILWRVPSGERTVYEQFVEMGPNGPVRIDSFFALGPSGLLLGDGQGGYKLDPHFTSMAEFYDNFQYRSFPTFQ